MEIKKEITDLRDELIGLRRDFHKYPELGFEEIRTSGKVGAYLAECGLEVKRLAKTGIVGLLKGKGPGKTVMLRADMDALPVQEMNDIPYKSVHAGKMHACGHDGHTAMLLITVKILSRLRDKIIGTVKFVFQPNEENAGAALLAREGVLEDPKVDACLGLHLWTPIKNRRIGIATGPIMAGGEEFKITILGKGGHTGAPHQSVDPIITAGNIIQAVQIIQTREVDVLKPTLIMFGKIAGGSSSFVIPREVEMSGTIRYLCEDGEENAEKLKSRFERLVKSICIANRTDCEIKFIYLGRPVVNDEEMTDLVRKCAEKVVGVGNIVPFRSMVGDDFSEFAVKVPSAFYFIGAGNKEKETNYPHHHSRFNIDEDVLTIGAEMHVQTALEFLGVHQ